jgi:cytidylate kinase
LAIVTISRGTLGGGRQLAESLADQLGYRLVSREDLSVLAAKMGAPVEKLRAAIARPPRYYNQLHLERAQYLSCFTMLLCEMILKENLVYYGHSAHLLLCGVPSVLRVMVLAGQRFRVDSVMRTQGLSRARAVEHIAAVDAGRDRWVRFLYDIDWRDPINYDFVVHIDQVGWAGAARALCSVAESTDFQLNQAAERVVKNLHLASKVRFALSQDPLTRISNPRVSAFDGFVQLVFQPRNSEVIESAKELVSRIPEVRDYSISIARNNILFLQDQFNCQSSTFSDVTEVAEKLDAALELVTFRLPSEIPDPKQVLSADGDEDKKLTGSSDGGLATTDDGGDSLGQCLTYLRGHGCAGSCSTFCGDDTALLSRLRRIPYALIVLGDLFTGRDKSIQTRMRADLQAFLTDNTSIPVVDARELKDNLSVSVGQILSMILGVCVAGAIGVGAYLYQEPLLTFLSGGEDMKMRMLAVALVAVITPLFAWCYGNFTGQILRFFRLD